MKKSVFSYVLFVLIGAWAHNLTAIPTTNNCSTNYDERSCLLHRSCMWDDFSQVCMFDQCSRHHHHHACIQDGSCTWDYESHLCETDN